MQKMMTDRRYIFMGTPAFASSILEYLLNKGFKPLLVITQPDRPVGRKAILTPSPVKQLAVEYNVDVSTPERLMDDDLLRNIQSLKPEFIVTAAYGKLVPLALLAMPEFGCLNVHTSLLPKYRGASPVAAAILAGDKETGVTIMQMDQGLDTGPILTQKSIPIDPEDTTGSLTEKLATIAGPLLIKTLEGVLSGKLRELPQDEANASSTSLLTNKDGLMDFTTSAVYLERQVRAMKPWPKAYGFLADRKINVEKAEVISEDRVSEAPGTIVGLTGGIDIACGQGVLRLLEIVPAGSKRMPATALAHNLTLGDRFRV